MGQATNSIQTIKKGSNLKDTNEMGTLPILHKDGENLADFSKLKKQVHEALKMTLALRVEMLTLKQIAPATYQILAYRLRELEHVLEGFNE